MEKQETDQLKGAFLASYEKLKAENKALRKACGTYNAALICAQSELKECKEGLRELQEQYREMLIENKGVNNAAN